MPLFHSKVALMLEEFPSAGSMPSASTEAARRLALQRYGILDTEAERAFDDLTALASQLCDAPASIITFIDGNRLWFKSTYGLSAKQAPVEHSFCAHAAGEPDQVFVVEDALSDGRFVENAFVMPVDGLRAYAAANIVDAAGTALGSICVVDWKQREFTDRQREALRLLSRQVVDQLELRRHVADLQRQRERLERNNAHFVRIAYVLAHDLRAPFTRQRGVLKALREDCGAQLEGEASQLVDLLERGSSDTMRMLDDLMTYLHEGTAGESEAEEVPIAALFARLRANITPRHDAEVVFEDLGVDALRTQPIALEYILLNLIRNALKYVGRPDALVVVRTERCRDEVCLSVIDNGPGIPEAERSRVFELFTRGSTSRNGDGGSGVGLAIVERLAIALGGSVDIADAEGGGCHFKVRLPWWAN